MGGHGSDAAPMSRAVFLDRDGVLNRAVARNGRPHPPATLDAFEILPGVPQALERLRAAGFLLIVVTNQPDVTTGVQDRAVVDAMHDMLRDELGLDDIRTCFHVDADGCACRKPRPGMLLAAARERNIDLARSIMVGDRWRDVAAGRAAGCRTVFIDNGWQERRPDAPDHTVGSLDEAAAVILSFDSAGEAIHA